MCCAAGAGHYQVLSYLFKKEHDTLNLMEDRDVSFFLFYSLDFNSFLSSQFSSSVFT